MVLGDSGELNASGIQARVPTNSGSYHLFTYKHTHEGDYTESTGRFCKALYYIFLKDDHSK